MNKKEALSPKEEEILCLLWDNDAPMTTMEMSEKMEERGWSTITVFKTVQTMTEKGYIEVAGFNRSGKVYSRTFSPTMSKNAYFSSLLEKRGFKAESLGGLVTAFLGLKESDKKSKKVEEAIRRMEQIVEEVKKEEAKQKEAEKTKEE